MRRGRSSFLSGGGKRNHKINNKPKTRLVDEWCARCYSLVFTTSTSTSIGNTQCMQTCVGILMLMISDLFYSFTSYLYCLLRSIFLSLSLPFVSFIIPFGAVAFMLFHFDVEKNENMKRSVEMPHCKSLPFFHLNSTQSPPKRKHPGGRVRISHSFFKIHCLL